MVPPDRTSLFSRLVAVMPFNSGKTFPFAYAAPMYSWIWIHTGDIDQSLYAMTSNWFRKPLQYLTIGFLAVGGSCFGTIPAIAETPLDYKQKAAGFLGQALCSQMLNKHSEEYMEAKIQRFINAYPEASMEAYLQQPMVSRAASVLAMSMNSTCTGFNQNSAKFKEAMKLMDRL